MIRFGPTYHSALWGGRRFEQDFGRSLPDGAIGEIWELVELNASANGDGAEGAQQHSQVVDGPLAGKSLGELWRTGALGGSAKGPFPFLLKWIDANQQLSVQVHPTAAACKALGKGQPKTEAWYVASSVPGATLLVGHYPGMDAATLRQAAEGGTLQKWLYETQPRPGDMFLLDAGTVHAIGAGFLLLEVQEPSNTTFRIYDWGRVDVTGEPRELHLDEAAAAVDYDRYSPPRAERKSVQGPCFSMAPLGQGEGIEAGPLRVFAAACGPAVLTTGAGEVSLAFGDVVVAEPSDGTTTVSQGSVVLLGEATAS